MESLLILVIGDPLEGFRFVGPFGSKEEAEAFADEEAPSQACWLAELETQASFAEPRPAREDGA